MTKSETRIDRIVSSDRPVHLVRTPLPRRRGGVLVGQPFPMVVWIQNASARLRVTEGQARLSEGDMVFVRAGEAFSLQGKGEEPLAVAVAFDTELVDAFAARHPGLGETLFWSKSPMPEVITLEPRELADVNQAALRLERATPNLLEAEAFLAPLIARVQERKVPLPGDAPDWLAPVLAAARDPRIFRDGAAGLARAAGRSHPHVSRTVRRYTGLSPSDYVNQQRMSFAARRLSATTDSLAEIAADCGVPNLSHFHKLFRVHHGTTPAEFRRRYQRALFER